MLRRRLSTLSNVDCIPVVCFSIFDHTQRACLSALLRIPEILFFSRFSTFSCSSVAIWLMKRDSSSVPMGLCPILLPILLQSYIYFRERRTNKAAERERAWCCVSGKNRIRIQNGERSQKGWQDKRAGEAEAAKATTQQRSQKHVRREWIFVFCCFWFNSYFTHTHTHMYTYACRCDGML